ncbi:MAG: bifunctional (p)ppGpp synthetase/guanosine-3',5'-bis(diphosphate) 3'-pyrophosphohydrolase [Bacteroidales bacterium]|nr:bifunctional (p)ppGpp synthetase/guanosine-3',5'-bis(diphosphate) 3'-pyrophosphohydrolase [Bacteroidales bacterium]MBN2817856.1 bifunctional (p)ppGpp synthetase/guanosine-3',5'-bis(diphosphate) 3'-pyrophosphohydrolase [Bacteroidales bacterium]
MTDFLTGIDTKYISEYEKLKHDLKLKKSSENTQLLDKAFSCFVKACNKDSENSPDLIFRTLKAAKIAVNDIGLGHTSLISLFIYHSFTTEPSDYKEIEDQYDHQATIIIKGLTNVARIEEKSVSSQAENFRRLLLNLAKDVRVILIILAEQLQMMRDMKNFPPEEQYRIASEASYLYAPLAHRLGLYLIKSEMEDISLKYSDRLIYDDIARKLDETMRSRKSFISKFIKPIREALEVQGFDFEIKGRPKSIYSIWNKMRKKEVGFEDIYDLFAIRIILKTEHKNEKADCWQVYSAVTDIYQPNPLRMRDWISVPKTNGYESLHTTVIGPDGKWVEVQIRTERMNEIAEKGVAAHWKYKGLEGEKGLDSWLTKIREILETPEPDAADFIDDFKLSLYTKEIFVFTPKGDLRKFPEGASVLDFAYDVHTQVGASCTGAKLNGKVVPIRHKLQNGDKVEILTSKNQTPKLDWLNIVVTSRAQKKIRQALNEEKVKEAENGKEILMRRFKNWKIEYNDENIRKLLKQYKLPNAQELYCMISTQKIELANIKDLLIAEPETIQAENLTAESLETVNKTELKRSSESYLIIDEKVANIDYKLAKCCNPIMGDNVFGFVTISDGIKIHRTNCPNAAEMIGRYGYRVVSAKWTRQGKGSVFPVTLKITGEEQAGILNNISEVLSKDMGINLRSIKLDASEGAFSGTIGIVVKDLDHLDFVINRLAAIKGVYSVRRADK